MSLFSFLRKNKQEPGSEDSTFYSRAEEESNKVRSRSRRRQSGSQNNQRSEPADPVLPEKKRARRRLIGAVALVLAAIIGLPMILDSEPKPVADDISIQIPSKDKPASATAGNRAASAAAVSKVAASASLDPKEEEVIDAPAAGSAPDEKPAAGEPAAKPAVVAETAAATAKPHASEEARPVAEAGKANRLEKPHAAALPAAKSESKSEGKAAEKKVDDAARAKALLEGKEDPKSAEKKTGKFVIQVAALASKEKVDELQSKLRGAGIKSYTQKVATGSGERIRIRVGPFASKEEAEKARARIVKLGLNGSLVPA